MENSMKFPQNINTTTTYSQAIPLEYISQENKSTDSKNIGILMFMATLFTLAENWEHPKCPSTDEWIKIIYIYIYTQELQK